MKVNILARPDHSLKLFESLNFLAESEQDFLVDLYTFYCLRSGSMLSTLFPKLKKAPSSSNTLDMFTFSARITTLLCKRYGLNFRKSEIFLLEHFAPWSRILDADLVHYWPFYCSEKIKIAKDKLGLKTVAEYYEAEPDFVNAIYNNNLERYGLSNNTPINLMIDQNHTFEFETNFIVGSEFTKNSYLRKFPNAKIHVCSYGPSGFSLVQKPKPLLDKSKRLKLVFVGQICIEKGVDKLLESIQELNVSLDLVGPIRSGQEKIFSKLMSSCKNCIYHGPKRHSEVLDMLVRFDIFCLPSLADNYSLAVVEALSRAMPVIVTDHCGNADDIQKFNLGYVAKAGCSLSLQQAIYKMCTEFDLHRFAIGLDEFFSSKNIQAYPSSVLQVYREIFYAK